MKLGRQQRGAIALVVALVLVVGMTLVAFFANRGMIFEQKTSANQYRSTRAFEMAEAGLEWAVARLNDDLFLNSACNNPGVTGNPITNSFRERYLATTSGANPSFNITETTPPQPHAACSVAADGTATCSCPTSGTLPTLGNPNDARFAVRFSPGDDPLSVQIFAYGCTNQGHPCDFGASATPDATAVVRALYKVRPKFPSSPGAGLVAGSAATTGGNLNVINLDVKSNGITINSGTTVDMGTGTAVYTLPGTPPHASVLDNDFSLNELTRADANGDLFFQSFFGETQEQYRNNPQTWIITSNSCGTRVRCTQCSTDTGCGTAVANAINNGVVQFWADTNVQFGSGNLPAVGTLGTATRPISFAGTAAVELRSNITAYGMFFVATATAVQNWDYAGSGSAKVYGAFVSRGDFVKGSGTLDLIYDASIFRAGEGTGLLVRVPGSWRDTELPF